MSNTAHGLPNAEDQGASQMILGIAFGTLALLALGCYVSGDPRTLNYGYPAACTILALLFYLTRPVLYVGFVMSVWFTAPFVRRIVDYWAGIYTETSPVILAPYLASGVALMTVFNYFNQKTDREYKHFMMIFGAIAYATLIGLVQNPFEGVLFGVVEWLVPVSMAIHIWMHWHLFPELKRVIGSTFVVGGILMGLYGVYQFVVAPPWDTFWLEQSGMVSAGQPVPYGIRVFGTINAPGPYAITMMCCFLMVFSGHGKVLRFLGVAPTLVGIALSMVRSTWGGTVMGVMYALMVSSGRSKVQILVLLGIGLAISYPILTYGPFADQVSERTETLSNLESDGSMEARMNLYANAPGFILTNPLGLGMGALGKSAKVGTGNSVTLDSGVLTLPIGLGWLGGGLYGFALLMMVFRAINPSGMPKDPFVVTLAAVTVGFMGLTLFASQFVAIKGALMWMFLSSALAGRRYYEYLEYQQQREQAEAAASFGDGHAGRMPVVQPA